MTYYAVDISFVEEVQMTARAVPAETPEEAVKKVADLVGNNLREFKVLGTREDDISDLEDDLPATTPSPVLN